MAALKSAANTFLALVAALAASSSFFAEMPILTADGLHCFQCVQVSSPRNQIPTLQYQQYQS